MSGNELTYITSYIANGQNSVMSVRNFYDTILIQNKNNPNHIYRTSFGDFFLKYRKELNPSIEIVILPERYFYQPKSLSFELYGTTELWLSLLRVNNMRNITEFNLPMIKVYNKSDIETLINIFFKREEKII